VPTRRKYCSSHIVSPSLPLLSWSAMTTPADAAQLGRTPAFQTAPAAATPRTLSTPRSRPSPAAIAAAKAAQAAAAADLGMAAEGERCRVEGEAADDSDLDIDDIHFSRSAGVQPQGEPDVRLPEEEEDLDKRRAAMMKAARAKSRRVAQARDSRDLPGIPGSGTDARAAIRRRTGTLQQPARSCPAQCAFCCRICLKWRVLKHVLMALFLPIVCTLGAIYWFYFMPTMNLSLGDALLRADEVTVQSYLRSSPALLESPLEHDTQRRLPLHLAALGNSTKMVKYLIELGAKIDSTDAQGLTALHYAAHVSNFDMVDYLISKGAPVEARDDNLRTPLHIASMVGSLACMAALVFQGQADLRAQVSRAPEPQ
jgi:hypothetical protein